MRRRRALTQACQLESDLDIPVMDILITDAAIPIRTTDTTVDRHFIGTVVTASIIRADIIGITGIGTKPDHESDFSGRRVQSPSALFFR